MKTMIAKGTVLALALGILLNAGLYAQYNSNTTNSSHPSYTTKATPATTATKQAQPVKSRTSAHKMLTKKDWQKRYNEIKPKVDALSKKAKAETNTDLSTAVTKMNNLTEDFK